MAASNISLDLQTLIYNLGKFTSAQEGLSTGSDVTSSVRGNDGTTHSVAPEITYYSWLTSAASAIATTTEGLRQNLTANADALRDAARQLVERNEISAEESQQFLALIDGATATPAPSAAANASGSGTGTAAGSAYSGASAIGTGDAATAGADAGKSAFDGV
ncbi:hypothetical protein GCM10027515_08460 [Schumannella luteola]|uniref:Uncharacterized protein n=1 Tax=Schumannella luteola TaxID=472059 RepID=A0A852YLE1_9MICO|nr:hypothetical protein [Schumannella luteola]NYG98025.1 hypothetical protein [Schumannella luteola]TPX01756.1 hypothetical protein FJ656_25515 [Schumannella luteola]